MKLKVCGMREENNIRELMSLAPDFMGMIFYPKSPRFIPHPVSIENWPKSIQRVGVFVNPTFEEVIDKVEQYQLDLVQLHGGESVPFVRKLRDNGISVIKVFGVTDQLPLEKMKPYQEVVDYFMFDTKTPKYGGSGEKFDWNILEDYNLATPFFLSGGIDQADIGLIRQLKTDKLFAIDINSRFELEPGLKDIQKIKEFKAAL